MLSGVYFCRARFQMNGALWCPFNWYALIRLLVSSSGRANMTCKRLFQLTGRYGVVSGAKEAPAVTSANHRSQPGPERSHEEAAVFWQKRKKDLHLPLQKQGLIVQWIERGFPKPEIQVRFLVGLQMICQMPCNTKRCKAFSRSGRLQYHSLGTITHMSGKGVPQFNLRPRALAAGLQANISLLMCLSLHDPFLFISRWLFEKCCQITPRDFVTYFKRLIVYLFCSRYLLAVPCIF